MATINVKCRCGAIELAISGDPVVQLYCHCDDCRAAHGAAYVAASIYPKPAVSVVRGEPTPMVVKTTQRMCCPKCGTPLFSEIDSAGLRGVNAFLLPAGAFQAQMHVQCEYAVLPVVDNLPHYRHFPASFGGAEEFVEW